MGINRGSYDEIVKQLALADLTDQQILSHFDGKPAFREYRERWTVEESALFCRLARLTHDLGLDWWHISRGVQVRFGWKEPNTERANAVLGTVQGKTRRTISIRRTMARMLETINRRIELLYDRDHCIGHAYLTPLSLIGDQQERLATLGAIFQSKIIPLLEEYFFDDWRKIRLVLGDNQKTHARHQFVLELSQNEELVAELFGDTHEMDSLLSRPRYEIQKSAFTDVESYIGIYTTTR